MKRIKIKLEENEVLQLEALLLKHRDRKVYRRLMCIRLLNNGKRKTYVSEALGVTLETIKNWLTIYCEDGLEGLTVLYKEVRRSSMEKHILSINSFVNERTISSIWEVVDYVNNDLGLPVKYHAVRNFLKKNLISLTSSQCKYHLKRQTKVSKNVL